MGLIIKIRRVRYMKNIVKIILEGGKEGLN